MAAQRDDDDERALMLCQTMNVCSKQVQDVVDGRIVASLLANRLLSAYLQVCMQAGGTMETLGYDTQASYWYSQGAELATVIATEDFSLQLYSILRQTDLESLLGMINKACLCLLRLDRSLQFENAVHGDGEGDREGDGGMEDVL